MKLRGEEGCLLFSAVYLLSGADSIITGELLTSVYQKGKIKKPFLQVLLQN